ncbi:TlpA family protein disulfide reductase [Christiangramia flava]|uniref:Thiol-disulfide isomerase and thioredoxin n=1 Tax=Christiangramia flava JLT2011 TaxID=1229726 RepID=A0A1L7I1X8_9FLAO|nr:TlpA disulfide reductase family protein [Christiangramia flava]APU67204.1 Thiol-disulfide isomerase and thioredoxin [Christiangramia flava JLT2011]OSS39789.1 Redoxin domain protein [Christiangramia flava JLT2011]
MKPIFSLLICALLLAGCSQKPKYQDPDIDFPALQKDFVTWLQYDISHIDLSANFIALDENAEEISKRQFLNKLNEGSYFPVKMISEETKRVYRLQRIIPNAPVSIGNTVQSQAQDEQRNYRLVENDYPDFKYTDIDGNTYTKNDLLGKVIVFKFWFIHCLPCVKEIPEMNRLVEKYRDENVIFLSLAFDEEEELRNFLSERTYNYRAIAVSKDYISDTLKVDRFPTHMIVDTKGKIWSVINDTEHLSKRLEDILRE